MNLLHNEGRNPRNLARSWDLSSRPELQLLLEQPGLATGWMPGRRQAFAACLAK
jgi:hypothetical protein